MTNVGNRWKEQGRVNDQMYHGVIVWVNLHLLTVPCTGSLSAYSKIHDVLTNATLSVDMLAEDSSW